MPIEGVMPLPLGRLEMRGLDYEVMGHDKNHLPCNYLSDNYLPDK